MRTNKTPAKEAAISIMRIALIVAAATVGTLGLMAIPNDDSPTWLTDLYLSKAIAAAGWYVAWLLNAKWSKVDKWIGAFNEDDEKALNTPVQLYIDKEGEQL